MTRILVSLLVIFAFQGLASAHEGHSHTPEAITLPHGGVAKATASLYWELVTETDGFKLFAFQHDKTPVKSGDLTVKATLRFPKDKKAQAINLQPVEGGYSAKVDAKGQHRYMVSLAATYKGKKETTQFQIETQE